MLRTLIDEYRAAFRGLSRRVWLLALVTLINRMGSMVAPFLILYLTEAAHYSEFEAGVFLALNGCGAFAGIAYGGRLTDTIGARTVMLASLVSTGVVLLVLGRVESTVAIAATVTVLGFVSESFRPAMSAATAACAAPEDRARAFGLTRLAINLGWSFGPALGGFLAAVDYQLLFWVDGISCLLAALTLALAIPGVIEVDTEPEAPSSMSGSPWRDTVYLGVLGLSFLQMLVFFQLHAAFPVHLVQDRGFSKEVVGILLGVNTVVVVAVEMLLIRRVQGRRPMRLLAASGVLVAAGYGLLVVPGGIPWVVVTVVMWTFGEMLFAPVLSAWIANRAAAGVRGRYMAAWGMSSAAGRIVAPLIGTALYQFVGPRALWFACFGAGAVLYCGYRSIDARLARPDEAAA